MSRRIVLVAAIAIAPLSGCLARPISATDWAATYTKTGLTLDQLETDALDCHWNATGERFSRGHSYLVAGLPGLVIPAPTPETHAACMRDKGYTVTR